MMFPDRKVLTGMFLGAVSASAIAAIGPGLVFTALADEFVPQTRGIDPSKLVRFEGERYRVEHEDWVDTTPTSTARVKKIEGGRVSYVTITTTATGTYSSDAMFSPHVHYPGIEVQQVSSRDSFSYWTNGRWTAFRTAIGDSFVYRSFKRN